MIGRCHSDVFYILHHVAVLFINFTMLLLTIFWSFTLAPLVYQLSNICFMWCFIVRKMVMLKVISLALLFMIRIRFPADKSIAYILRSRYGNTSVKEVRKLEKIDYKLNWNIETVYKSLKSRGSRFGILYGLCKVHKQLVDNCPPYRPIMSESKHLHII